MIFFISAANQCVKLTLQSCPEGEAQDASHRPLPPTPNPSKYNDRITAPLPVNVSVCVLDVPWRGLCTGTAN